MSIKSCVYKGCENYTINNVPSGNFTIFQFPKDPERRRLWMELGQVPQNWPINNLLMCSDHFDRKYMSINQRRTVLVGPAVPYGYVESSASSNKKGADQEASDQEGSYVFYAVSEVDEQEFVTQEEEKLTDQLEVESVPSLHEPEEYEKPIDDSENSATGLTIMQRKVSPSTSPKCDISTLKRKGMAYPITEVSIMETKKAFLASVSSANPVRSTATSQSTQPKANDFQQTALEVTTYDLGFNETDLIDDTQVSTFKIRSEEYVQMTRKHYLDEKIELLRKLRRYESFIRDIKEKCGKFKLN